MDNNISIEDLKYYVTLLDQATLRGCLQGEDLYPAGTLRQKLIVLTKSENSTTQEEQITFQDLNTIINLIDLMAKKGGLVGEDLLPVGTARQKLANFIIKAQQINQENTSNNGENLGENNG